MGENCSPRTNYCYRCRSTRPTLPLKVLYVSIHAPGSTFGISVEAIGEFCGRSSPGCPLGKGVLPTANVPGSPETSETCSTSVTQPALPGEWRVCEGCLAAQSVPKSSREQPPNQTNADHY